MKDQIIIPEKISIHLLCELLSLSGMQERAKLDALKQYSNESGLLFTFISMTEVKALPINMPIGDEYGENNEFIDHHDAKEESIEWFNCISFTLNQYFLSEGKATTCINWFQVNGESFHVINDDNNNVGNLFINLSNVYVKRSDFINFIDKSGDNAHSAPTVDLQPARTNKVDTSELQQEVIKYPPLEQRYKFLKEWTQKTLKGVPFDEFIAKYDIELTKETFYELLRHEYKKNHPNDSNIFVKGIDEFYKDSRITFDFKRGRRKKVNK